MITILNYGMGNLGSIHNMFKKIGVESAIVTTPAEVARATSLVLPGVGHFDHAMASLRQLDMIGALEEAALVRRIPVLGICLGMQLMTQGSEEASQPGLGWLRAETRLIDGAAHAIRVPHMGWNTVHVQRSNALFDFPGSDERRFYFVHSYAIQCHDADDVIATTSYGTEFVSAFGKDNLLGVQFHPEKSHKFGMHLLRRFATACGCDLPMAAASAVLR